MLLDPLVKADRLDMTFDVDVISRAVGANKGWLNATSVFASIRDRIVLRVDSAKLLFPRLRIQPHEHKVDRLVKRLLGCANFQD